MNQTIKAMLFFKDEVPLQSVVGKIMCFWMFLVTVTIFGLARYATDEQQQFYTVGPNEHLHILGFAINNYARYVCVIVYCFVNSMIRTMNSTILHPWLLNNIQDESKYKTGDMVRYAYELTTVSSIYTWFDWFIYMNVLLAQIDMLFFEIVADLLMALLTTKYYIEKSPTYLPL